MLSPEAHKKWYESGEKPNVDQMLMLQKIGIVTAKEQQKLKESQRANNAHIFLAKQIDGYASTPFDDDYYWSHRFTGRVARIGFRRWSMRIAEAFWIQEENDGPLRGPGINKANDGHRTTYKFEWTDKVVQSAEKHIKILDLEDSEIRAPQPDLVLVGGGETTFIEQGKNVTWQSLDVEPQGIDILNGLAEAQATSEFVSQADCERLAADMLEFSASSMRRHFQMLSTSGTNRFI